jgi:hypothetical protein
VGRRRKKIRGDNYRLPYVYHMYARYRDKGRWGEVVFIVDYKWGRLRRSKEGKEDCNLPLADGRLRTGEVKKKFLKH